MDQSPQSKGGQQRAAKLSPEERSRIAKAAAEARWSLPRAEYEGDLEIPGIVPLRVANLSDGRRVMISRAILEALGRPWKGTYQRTERPNFIDAKNLNDFVTRELTDVLAPVDFINERGQTVSGYLADLLPLVCDVYLRARDQKKLTKSQQPVAEMAELIMRGLAKVGLYSLIDDATGYTRIRAQAELQAVLAAYISPELLPYGPKFPEVFYEQLHRVRGWPYRPGNTARNSYIGKLTRALIYDPLPTGVREELERRNPYIPEKEGRQLKHYRLLTKKVGIEHLEKQLTAVTTLLRISDTWSEFLRHFGKAFPPREGFFALPEPPKEASE